MKSTNIPFGDDLASRISKKRQVEELICSITNFSNGVPTEPQILACCVEYGREPGGGALMMPEITISQWMH
jgi:hypothetical protein